MYQVDGPRARCCAAAAAVMLMLVLSTPAQSLAQVPGAEYVGTIEGGGTVKLSLWRTGSEILDFRAFNVPGQQSTGACTVYLAGLYLLHVPVVGESFLRPDPSGQFTFSGTFTSPQNVRGTLSIVHEGCASGVKSWSASTTATPPPQATKPANTSLPKITGKAKLNRTLKVSAGTWRGTARISYKYQWKSCDRQGRKCQAIPGATKTALRISTRYRGRRLVVAVTASNAAGRTTVTSKATGVVTR